MNIVSIKHFFFAVLALTVSALAAAGVQIQHWTTANGVRVYFVESRGLPMLDVQVDFAAGSMFDPPGKSGVAALTRTTLDLGAGERDESALAEQLADVGAQLAGSADTDRAGVSLRTLSAAEQLMPALEVLRAVLHAPRFDDDIFEREKARTIASLKEAMTRPDSIAGKAFWAALYPAHPYGQQATPESLAKVTRDDILAFYARHYTASQASITLVGNISREQAEAIAASLAEGLQPGEPLELPAVPVAPKAASIRLPHPASQAHVYIGLPAIERGNPDFFPLVVGNYTLGGGGFMSRLMKEVRDKRGFVYGIYSYFSPLRQSGPFQIGLQTKRSQAKEAIRVTREVLDTFLKHGPSEDELAAAKANLMGSFPLRLDSNKKILDNVSIIGFYGLPLDYLDTYRDQVQAVTVDQIKAAFARHVSAAHLQTVTVAAD